MAIKWPNTKSKHMAAAIGSIVRGILCHEVGAHQAVQPVLGAPAVRPMQWQLQDREMHALGASNNTGTCYCQGIVQHADRVQAGGALRYRSGCNLGTDMMGRADLHFLLQTKQTVLESRAAYIRGCCLPGLAAPVGQQDGSSPRPAGDKQQQAQCHCY
jgi:hypothetical protein